MKAYLKQRVKWLEDQGLNRVKNARRCVHHYYDKFCRCKKKKRMSFWLDWCSECYCLYYQERF